MRQLLPYMQLLISVLLMGSILLQQRGASTGAAFGGESSAYGSRRGFEKKLYVGTIILGFLFFASAALAIFLR